MPKAALPGTMVATHTRSTTAPSSVRGILLQVTRFLYYLLRGGPHDVVSLELFEDVGVEHHDGTKTAEQDKSFLSRNPLADRSTALWKTLHNWVDAVSSGALVPEHSRFVIYAPKAAMGDFSRRLHGAKTTAEAESALQHVRRSLAGPDGLVLSSANRPHVEAVLSADQELLATIVEHFTVDTDEQPEDALRSLLQEKLVGEDAFDNVLTWSHGWVKRTIDVFLQRGQPARVARHEFHQALLNYVRLHDRDSILRSVAGTATAKEITAEHTERPYVRQLQIIDLDDLDILTAVNDFLTASVDRTSWAARGLISETALDTFQIELQLLWRNKRMRTRVGHPEKDPVSQGQLLFFDCIEQYTKLDDLETPRAFVRGSWHALADDLAIGWHPAYKKVLSDLKSTNSAKCKGSS